MRERSRKNTYEFKLLLARPNRGDWSDREHSQIDRIRLACVEYPDLKLEFGQTDEGDPWCIVYDHPHDRVIAHIARIDRHYVVSPYECRLYGATTIAEAVEIVIGKFGYDQRVAPIEKTNALSRQRA